MPVSSEPVLEVRTLEKSKPTEKEVKPTPVKEVEKPQKPEVVERLEKVREQARINAEQAEFYLKLFSPDSKKEVPLVSVPEFQEMATQFQEKKDLTPREYIMQGGYIQDSAVQIEAQINLQVSAITQQKEALDAQSRQLYEQIQAIDQRMHVGQKLFAKIRPNAQKKELEEKKLQLFHEAHELTKKIWDLENQEETVKERVRPISKNREDMLGQEIAAHIRSIPDGYKKFLESASDDASLTHVFREAYMSRFIDPILDTLQQEGIVSDGERERFVGILRTLAYDKNLSYEEKQNLELQVSGFGIQHRGSVYLEWAAQQFYNSDIYEDISKIVIEKVVAEDLEKIAKQLEASDVDNRWNGGIPAMLDLKIVEKALPLHKTYLPRSLVSLKDITVLPVEFSQIIEGLNKTYYEVLLGQSTKDTSGSYIDGLVLYPTPDSIRNLVLIASADSQQYRTVHANGALSALAQRSDWNELLEKAIEEYPLLREAQEVLKSFNSIEHEQDPNLQKATHDFSASILSKPEEYPSLQSIARETMPTEELLGMAVARGNLTQEEASHLVGVSEILDKTYQTQEVRELLGKGLIIDTISLPRLIRFYTTTGNESGLKKLANIASKITERQENPREVAYLSSQSVMEVIQGSRSELSEEQLEIVLEGYRYCPALLENKALSKLVFDRIDKFGNIEGFQFLQEVSNRYSGNVLLRGVMVRMIEQTYAENALSRERVLELSEKIKDIDVGGLVFDDIAFFPDVFLKTDENVEFLKDFLKVYTYDNYIISNIRSVAFGIRSENFTPEDVLQIPKHASHLVADSGLFSVILQSPRSYGLHNIQDYDFIDSIVVAYPRSSLQWISGYAELVGRGNIAVENRNVDDLPKKLAEFSPSLFASIATKEQWQLVLGDEVFTSFLKALPTDTDERRNAFTRNEYDRTTLFIEYLAKSAPEDFSITPENFQILTDYVKEYGLAKTAIVFRYYKHLSLRSQGKIKELPEDIDQSGIQSIEELSERFKKIRQLAYGQGQMTDVAFLTQFEMEILKVITGKASHRFDSGRPNFEQIVSDFQTDQQKENITKLPSKYKPGVIEIKASHIEFNAERVQSDYEALAQEIIFCLENPGTNALKEEMQGLMDQKIASIEALLLAGKTKDGKEIGQKQREFMEKDRDRVVQYKDLVEKINDSELFLSTLLDMKIDKTELPAVNSIIRRVILQRLLEKNPNYTEELQNGLEHGLSPEAILFLVNFIGEPVQEHVINSKKDTTKDYWSEEVVSKIRKNGQRFSELYEPYLKNLKTAITEFKNIEGAGSKTVQMIPDRGFIGEMSGYLADVCYTAEYPLLKRFPNVIPYKFVDVTSSGDPKFIGSVLVFELKDAAGEPAMLLRGFDVPSERDYDIAKFIEEFIDKMEPIARERGIRKIIIPGSQGALSNYTLTLNHMNQTYFKPERKISLQDRFAFNGYDITNNSYVVREVPLKEPEALVS